MGLIPEIATCYCLLPEGEHWSVWCSRRRRGRVTYERVWSGTIPGPDQERLREVIRSVAGEVDRGGAFTVAPFPASRSIVRVLSAPRVPRRRLPALIPSLLDVELPFPVEEAAYVVNGVAETPSGYRVSVTAARRRDVGDFLEELSHTIGLDPVILDPEPSALWDECRQRMPAADAMLIVCRRVGAWLALVGDAAGPRAVMTLPVPQPDAEPDEAALSRISAVAEASLGPAGGDLVWLWCNMEASLPALVRRTMENRIGRHITEQTLRQPDLLARALGRRALLGRPYSGGGLRTGDLTHPAQQAYVQRRRRAVHFAYIGLSLLLLAVDAACVGAAAARERGLQKRLRRAARALIGPGRVTPPGEELRAARRAYEQKRAVLTHLYAAEEPAASRILAELLRTAVDSGLRLQEADVSAEAVRLAGTAPRGREERLVAVLRASGYEAAIAQRADAGNGRVTFVVEGIRP